MTIWLRKDLISEIDQIAEEGSLTRSRLLKNLITAAVGEIEIIDKIGMLRHSMVMNEFGAKLKNQINKELRRGGLKTIK